MNKDIGRDVNQHIQQRDSNAAVRSASQSVTPNRATICEELETDFEALQLGPGSSATTIITATPGERVPPSVAGASSSEQASTAQQGGTPAQLNFASLLAHTSDAAATLTSSQWGSVSGDSTAAQHGSSIGSMALPLVQPVGGIAADDVYAGASAAAQRQLLPAPADLIADSTSASGEPAVLDQYTTDATKPLQGTMLAAQASGLSDSVAAAPPPLAPASPATPSAQPEQRTPQQATAAAHVGLVLPAEAVTAMAAPSAPEEARHIQVKLTRDEAAALAEQLAAVSLQPVTPPAKQIQKDVRVGLVYDVSMQEHIGPESHWERPARTADLFRHITDEGLAARCWTLPARQATDAQLRRAHTQEHIASVDAGFDTHADTPSAGDMYYSAGTAAAARMAAGCTIQAAERVAAGDVERAFAVVRPPGHHAECACAMGFCFYNNAALAALGALERGCRRVLLFDWDVHHGNGTEHILESDPRVLYMSLHRGNGFYPGTGLPTDVGKGKGEGFSVNVAWQRAGVGDADYLAAWELVLGPVVAAFQPELIIVSAGFDAAEGDPLGCCRLTPHGYGRLTELLLQHANGKCVMALEGGYNTRVISEAAATCLEVLLGGKAPPPDPFAAARPTKDTPAALAATAAAHAPFWPALAPLATKEGFKAKWQDYLVAIPTPKSQRKTRGNSKFVDFVLVT